MKVSQFIIAISIFCSPATAATRRRLNNTIKGDESSMSYASTLYAAKSGSSSRSKRGTMPPTGSPTGAPTSPEVSCSSYLVNKILLGISSHIIPTLISNILCINSQAHVDL